MIVYVCIYHITDRLIRQFKGALLRHTHVVVSSNSELY